MNLIEYWKESLSVVAFLVGVFSGGKLKSIREKKEGAGAIASLQTVYDAYMEHNKEVTKDLLERVKLVEKHNRELQKNFNDMSLAYSEVMGENKKIEFQYKELQREYEILKTAHESLKREFNDYKTKIKSLK